MSQFLTETEPIPVAEGEWRCIPSPAWNIGDTPNGGYAAAPVVRALASLGGHCDPLSVTTSYLRPVSGGEPAAIRGEVIRSGRTTTVVRGVLTQDGKERLTVLATLGDLDETVGIGPSLQPDAPPIPSPEECPSRIELDQGVALPILDRLDIRIDPACVAGGGSDRAVMAGWIRLHDGSEPSALTLALFADSFPPSLYTLVGRVGWVPTIELTVHVRRRPVAGWIQARFECDDLVEGRMIESGTLWDESGRVVARSRQLGLLLPQ